MSKIILSEDDLMEKLKEQIHFLQKSAKSFDEGDLLEAIRLAVSIRILVHDTSQSHSLLKQLDIIDKLDCLDTAFPYDPKNLLTHNGLVCMRVAAGSARCIPFLDTSYKKENYLKFGNWWFDAIVIKDHSGNTYSRKDIVLFISNKDGGAHVDPKIEEKYKLLKSGVGTGWELSGGGFLQQVIPASIRQIAYEVTYTLHIRYPDLF